MSTFKTHNHYANQRGFNQPIAKQHAMQNSGAKPTSPKSKPPRQAEEATSPNADTSNGGM